LDYLFLVWRIVADLVLIPAFATVYHRLMLPESTHQVKDLASGSGGHERYKQGIPQTSLGNSLFQGNPIGGPSIIDCCLIIWALSQFVFYLNA